MLIIEKLISDYPVSFSTNALVFKENKLLKAMFNTFFALWIISLFLLLMLVLNNQLCKLYWSIACVALTIIFLVLIQIIRNRAINRIFPKIKTSIWKLYHPEISIQIEKNIEKFIIENRLESKLSEVAEKLREKLDLAKNQNLVFFSIIGAILLLVLGCYLTSIFERLKYLSISEFTGIAVLIVAVIISLGIGLFYVRKFLDTFATNYEKISIIKDYIDDYRLKK